MVGLFKLAGIRQGVDVLSQDGRALGILHVHVRHDATIGAKGSAPFMDSLCESGMSEERFGVYAAIGKSLCDFEQRGCILRGPRDF
jgi:hypothetical protein